MFKVSLMFKVTSVAATVARSRPRVDSYLMIKALSLSPSLSGSLVNLSLSLSLSLSQRGSLSERERLSLSTPPVLLLPVSRPGGP
jgi:hypothetical protein